MLTHTVSKKPFLLLLATLFCLADSHFCKLYAQTIDTLKLPFAISKEKRLSDEDLANKKEGAYLTGIPDFSSDPVNGIGIGAEGSLFFNGKRSDPFFAYTPYRAELDVALFATTRNQYEAMFTLDVPYIFNTKWRLRAEAGYEKNPNLLYFGLTEQSLNGLSFYPGGDTAAALQRNVSYARYDKNLAAYNPSLNQYIKDEYILNVSIEHSYLDGKLRALFGYEIAQVGISLFSGRSKLLEDEHTANVLGLGKNIVTIAQQGLIYDTRDLETDPSVGVFAELTNELSLQALGSAFNFNKTFFHYNYYYNVFPKKIKKTVIAMRFAAGYTAGDAPFFEYQDQWSSEGSIEGLGGAYTLRGYKQSRFLGRVMSFNNLEIRYRIAQTQFLKQQLVISAVPFADAGAVWDKLNRVGHFENFRFSEGLGARVVWNINTVLRFDYAFSPEDKQFFFNLAHTF